MREFSVLFADLDQRFDEWGVLEGRPFLISPKGECGGGLAVNIIEC